MYLILFLATYGFMQRGDVGGGGGGGGGLVRIKSCIKPAGYQNVNVTPCLVYHVPDTNMGIYGCFQVKVS